MEWFSTLTVLQSTGFSDACSELDKTSTNMILITVLFAFLSHFLLKQTKSLYFWKEISRWQGTTMS